MLEKLANFIQHHQLFNFSDQLAIAVSGGKDSVFAAHALDAMGYTFVIIHCNFKLRDSESDADEQFVRELAESLKHCNGFFHRSFNTKKFATEHKLSIQEAARKLRYDLFEELYLDKTFDHLITAHHADDLLETFMINLERGSGLKGLKSIPIERAFLKRPMLSLRSAEILQYLNDHQINYREDSSNKSDNYLRNLLRNKILPQINDLLPDFSERAITSISYLRDDYELYNALLSKQSQQFTKQVGDIFNVDIQAVITYPHADVFLYNILESYQFNHDQCQQILSSISTGKEFISNSHKALLNRGVLEVSPLNKKTSSFERSIHGVGEYSFGVYRISLNEIETKDIDYGKSGTEYIDADKLPFPVTLRHWKQGDKMQPLGMKGSKLISDLLIDAKLSRSEKGEIPLLCKGPEILWLAGFRISEKLKISEYTQRIYAISYFKS